MCRGTAGMSGSCSPSEVINVCRSVFKINGKEAEDIWEVVQSMDSGFSEGLETRTPDEPSSSVKYEREEKEKLKTEKYLSLPEIFEECYDLIDSVIMDGVALLMSVGQMSLQEYFLKIGASLLSLCDEKTVEDICLGLSERPIEYTPGYFKGIVSKAVARKMLETLKLRYQGGDS